MFISPGTQVDGGALIALEQRVELGPPPQRQLLSLTRQHATKRARRPAWAAGICACAREGGRGKAC